MGEGRQQAAASEPGKGPSCAAGLLALQAGWMRGHRVLSPWPSAPSMEWFRNIGFAGSVNFQWCVAISLRLLMVPGARRSGLISSS